MKKGINVWGFDAKRPLPEVFATAKNAGFDGVEVAIALEGPITPATTESECHRIAEQAAEAGVEIVALASGLGWSLPMTTNDADVRRRGIDAVASSLQIARWLGTDAILCVPGAVDAVFLKNFAVTPYEAAYDNALGALQELAPVAAENAVTIGVENVWNMFLLSPLEMRTFIDTFADAATDSNGVPRIGSYFDVGNVVATGYPEQWIDILGERIARVHFKDFKRSIGNLSGFCDLGEGDVNWPAVLAALNRIGYDGYVTAEYFGIENELKTIAAAMDKILASGN